MQNARTIKIVCSFFTMLYFACLGCIFETLQGNQMKFEILISRLTENAECRNPTSRSGSGCSKLTMWLVNV